MNEKNVKDNFWVGITAKELGSKSLGGFFDEGFNRGRGYQHRQDVEWLEKHLVPSIPPLGLIDDDWQAFKNMDWLK